MKNKNLTKAHADFSVNKEILLEFKITTKKLFINKSALIESFMEEWLEKNKDKVSLVKQNSKQ
jgi:hypothetical protein